MTSVHRAERPDIVINSTTRPDPDDFIDIVECYKSTITTALEVFECAYAGSESFECGLIGSDVAYLMAAILENKHCEWDYVVEGPQRALLEILKQGLPKTHDVWRHVRLVDSHNRLQEFLEVQCDQSK